MTALIQVGGATLEASRQETILIVDDRPEIVGSSALLLDEAGHNYHLANSISEAEEILSEFADAITVAFIDKELHRVPDAGISLIERYVTRCPSIEWKLVTAWSLSDTERSRVESIGVEVCEKGSFLLHEYLGISFPTETAPPGLTPADHRLTEFRHLLSHVKQPDDLIALQDSSSAETESEVAPTFPSTDLTATILGKTPAEIQKLLADPDQAVSELDHLTISDVAKTLHGRLIRMFGTIAYKAAAEGIETISLVRDGRFTQEVQREIYRRLPLDLYAGGRILDELCYELFQFLEMEQVRGPWGAIVVEHLFREAALEVASPILQEYSDL